MLLYIHVPFCVRKCGYCAFHSGLYSSEAAARYCKLIVAEMAVRAAQFGRIPLETVYFGGGTPSLLEAGQIGGILDAVSRYFLLNSGVEITLEANPESVTRPGFLPHLVRLGVNRLSLGAQSFRDETLAILGRAHLAQDTMNAVRLARNAGLTNLSLDLIWGLPGQTLKNWLDELKVACGLRPEHLSCYGLTIEDGTPLAAQLDGDELTLPEEEEGARMYMHGSEYLESEGYLQYEISNYSRIGFQSRHNAGYWAQMDYLGIGPAAVSTVGSRRWTNPAHLDDYERAAGNWADVEELGARTRWQEMVMMSLRTCKGLDLERFKAMTGKDFLRSNHRLVRLLRTHRLVRLQNGHLRLTRNGMLVSNTIIERMFEGLDGMLADTMENV